MSLEDEAKRESGRCNTPAETRRGGKRKQRTETKLRLENARYRKDDRKMASESSFSQPESYCKERLSTY